MQKVDRNLSLPSKIPLPIYKTHLDTQCQYQDQGKCYINSPDSTAGHMIAIEGPAFSVEAASAVDRILPENEYVHVFRICNSHRLKREARAIYQLQYISYHAPSFF